MRRSAIRAITVSLLEDPASANCARYSGSALASSLGAGFKRIAFSTTAVSSGFSIVDVCAWATRVGLSEKSVAILQREEIDGAALFALTDAMLVKIGMPLGARMRLLASIARLREPGEWRKTEQVGLGSGFT